MPEGANDAMVRVAQRPLRVHLDTAITLAELEEVLRKTKSGKATSNEVPVELLEACCQSSEALQALHSLVSDVFEDNTHGTTKATGRA